MPKGKGPIGAVKTLMQGATLSAILLASPAVLAGGPGVCETEHIDVPGADFDGMPPWMHGWGGPQLFDTPSIPVAERIKPWQYRAAGGAAVHELSVDETFYFARPGDSIFQSISLNALPAAQQRIPWSVQYFVDVDFASDGGDFEVKLKADAVDAGGGELATLSSWVHSQPSRGTATVVLKGAQLQDARELAVTIVALKGNRVVPKNVSVRRMTCSQSIVDVDFGFD